MSAILIMLIALVLLALGYIFYGSFLAKQWGVDPSHETPAHTSYDGKDFVPANPAVLMGHHFSSIAGAGPINGPIQAAVFGWVPVFLWVVVGGIFFGAMHDFGALFASIRHNGGSIGEVIKENMGVKAQRLFTIFALLVLILVIASFTAVVAGTFVSVTDDAGNALPFITTGRANVSGNASTATTSLLFIVLAFFFGFAVYRKNVKVGPATIVGIIGIIVITIVGLNVGVNFNGNTVESVEYNYQALVAGTDYVVNEDGSGITLTSAFLNAQETGSTGSVVMRFNRGARADFTVDVKDSTPDKPNPDNPVTPTQPSKPTTPTVQQGANAPADVISNTGSNVMGMIVAAAVLVLAGGAMLLLRRQRNK